MNPSKLAVIETGGKQYLTQPGQVLKVEKLKTAKTGEAVTFDKVLLLIDGEDVKIGKPYLTGVTVSGTLKREGRAEKITILRYRRKTRSRKKKGHKQIFSEVQIGEIK
ncbi:50S ribosomal protein L21 [Candidatus Parcubacteria bacterium]|nr:MAG: 50S ribosomal protein L21 [Candidatus Parcubacteria bacterium]